MTTVRFDDVTLRNGTITAKGGEGGPVKGAQARVETSGDIDRRVTATRLLLTGPLAFGLRKKKDNRTLYLTIDGDGWGLIRECAAKKETDARKFAQAVNLAGQSG